jgi:CRISPR-associated protein Cmr3
MAIDLVLRPRDGLTLKDPRGFAVGGGVTAHGLPWPSPQTMAGAVRTVVGRARGHSEQFGEDPDEWDAVRRAIRVQGPIMVASNLDRADWRPLWPAPRDALRLPHPRAGKPRAPAAEIHWLEPQPCPRSGCRVRGLWSVSDASALEIPATEALWRPRPPSEAKPLAPRPLWSDDALVTWLLAPRTRDEDGWLEPPLRRDIHLKVDPDTLAAADEHLFVNPTCEALLALRSPLAQRSELIELGVALRVEGLEPSLDKEEELLAAAWRIGGEARFATAQQLDDRVLAASERLLQAWKDSRFLRLMLVTPARFDAGWRPDWLEPTERNGEIRFEGEMPGLGRLVVLRGACVDRPSWSSGWDLVKRRPKPSEACVAPGAVYYFESLAAPVTKQDARRLWLASIQQPEDAARHNGFGLVLPGIWPITA